MKQILADKWGRLPPPQLITLSIVIDEHNTPRGEKQGVEYPSLSQSMLVDSPCMWRSPKMHGGYSELQDRVLEAIGEQKAEVEQSQELIAAQGVSKIHNDEVIVTCAMCPLVLAFLTKAATQRKFHVIVAERAPKYDGHPVAKALCTAGIETTLIQDSAVFPIMSRVNKVIKGHRWHRDGGDQRRH
ncbi:translation initiation factor eIF2B subunit beta-like [Scylla paramamosain]|uniref:translation initiation factor eIF2B subunit beta-like n=1 Tax=Scylla paramamosain TaxID=85552 RepID=UPI003083A2C9